MGDYVLLLAIFVFLTTTIGFAVAWRHMRARAFRAESMLDTMCLRDTNADARLENTVEDLVREMERLRDGHRFLARLLTEQAPPLSQPVHARERRMDTPH